MIDPVGGWDPEDAPRVRPTPPTARRHETEPGGISYDRFRVARLHRSLMARFGIETAVEVPAGGAKACPSLYSLGLALGGCRIVTLVNPFPPALEEWRRVGLSSRVASVQARLTRLPFADRSFDLAWNFVTLGREDLLMPVLAEMGRTAHAVLLVLQNGYNLGYPWHRFLHWVFRIPWDHGQTRYFFPAEVRAEMRQAGLQALEVGLLDQVPWPDPPGFRDIRLHLSGGRPHPEEDVDWTVPAVDLLVGQRFPLWMRLCGAVEELPIPMALRWPVNHLYYVLGFPAGSRFSGTAR